MFIKPFFGFRFKEFPHCIFDFSYELEFLSMKEFAMALNKIVIRRSKVRAKCLMRQKFKTYPPSSSILSRGIFVACILAQCCCKSTRFRFTKPKYFCDTTSYIYVSLQNISHQSQLDHQEISQSTVNLHNSTRHITRLSTRIDLFSRRVQVLSFTSSLICYVWVVKINPFFVVVSSNLRQGVVYKLLVDVSPDPHLIHGALTDSFYRSYLVILSDYV